MPRKSTAAQPHDPAFGLYGQYLLLSREQQVEFWEWLCRELTDEESAGFEALGQHLSFRMERAEMAYLQAADKAATTRAITDAYVERRNRKPDPRTLAIVEEALKIRRQEPKLPWPHVAARLWRDHRGWFPEFSGERLTPNQRGVLGERIRKLCDKHVKKIGRPDHLNSRRND
jgi:hypothetical protein